MTDKEKLHQILSSLWKNDDSVGKVYYNQALQDVQTAIDLQEEPVNNGLDLGCGVIWKDEDRASDDLEEEARRYGDELGNVLSVCGDDDDNSIGEYAAQAYIDGAQWKEKQLIKNAIERKVKVDAGGYPYIDATIEFYDYEKDKPLAKAGDKVKVIAIVIKDK